MAHRWRVVQTSITLKVDARPHQRVAKGIEAGWERHRSATEQASRRLAAHRNRFVEPCRHADSKLDRKGFRHVTRRDELVCELCGPRDGQIFSGASNGPPVHPRCLSVAVRFLPGDSSCLVD